jgi:S-ribosylhomocysteine lyase
MDLDHHLMTPPFLRVKESRTFSEATPIAVWDLRIAQPNVSHVSDAALHSMEHFLGVLLPKYEPGVLNVAPLGCLTGFYIVTCGVKEPGALQVGLRKALEEVLVATEVPLANERDCGWAENHTLRGAKNLARWLLLQQSEWTNALWKAP